jgi:RND family efflux transporter MFP subunit
MTMKLELKMRFKMRPLMMLVVMTVWVAGSCRRAVPVRAEDGLPEVSAEVVEAVLEEGVATEEIVGTVRPRDVVVVEAKVSGRIGGRMPEAGTEVKAGEELAVIDAEEIRARAEQAKAGLEQARRDFARQGELLGGRATTRQDYESAETRVKVAEGVAAETAAMLGYTRITAPIEGRVTRKLAGEGDLAVPGKPLLEIETRGVPRFEVDLPETLVELVKLGDRMAVEVSGSGGEMEGTVMEMAPAGDAGSRTFRMKLALPEGAAAMRSGRFGRVAVPVGRVKRLVVPETAVVKRGQMEVVMVVREGRAVLRLVTTGRVKGGRVEVLSGLEAGERVVATGVERVKEGQPVTKKP